MIRPLVFAGFVLATSCSSPDERHHVVLMDKVEKQVQLPEGSAPIGDYARYYAFDDRQRVVAEYIMIVDTTNHTLDVPAGKRRWVDVGSNLPSIRDGGCSVVTVLFDPKSNKVDAWCNGVA
jgi:hypothetical protein